MRYIYLDGAYKSDLIPETQERYVHNERTNISDVELTFTTNYWKKKYLRFESHVEHSIRLIQHQVRHSSEVRGPAI